MAQFGRPVSTIATNFATAVGAATLHEATDEVGSDGDTTYVEQNQDNQPWTVKLSSVTDPAVGTGHVVRVLAKQGGGLASSVKVELVQGASTVIAATGEVAVTASYATYGMTLTAGEADSITDYADLRVRVTARNVLAAVRATQVELEVPPAPQIVAIGQVTEADAAQAVSRRKSRTPGQTTGTEIGQPLARSKFRPVGQATSTETVFAAAAAKVRPIGQAAGIEILMPLTVRKSWLVGQVTEAGTVAPFASRHSRTIGQVTEAGTAAPVVRVKRISVGSVDEVDTVLAVTPGMSVRVELGQVTEAGTCQTVGSRKARPVGSLTTTAAVLPIRPVRSRVLGQVLEAGTLTSVTSRKRQQVAMATEADQVFGLVIALVPPVAGPPHVIAAAGAFATPARKAAAIASTGGTA